MEKSETEELRQALRAIRSLAMSALDLDGCEIPIDEIFAMIIEGATYALKTEPKQ